jgi:predicted nucleotidyltransferase
VALGVDRDGAGGKYDSVYVVVHDRLSYPRQDTTLPTPYADINSLLENLLSRLKRALPETLVGLYLYGSLRTGDFDPDTSDIDLLAATTSDLSNAQTEVLQAMHRSFALDNPDWDNRIEVAYLSVAALRTFRSARSPIAVISPGEPFHIRKEGAGEEWLQNWYLIREIGVALFGPPAATIIPPITKY